MNKMRDTERNEEMASEYDFSKGVRGKYAARFPGYQSCRHFGRRRPGIP